MPLYEYRCLDCGRKFEYLLRTIQETVACPDCRGSRLAKLISAFSLGGRNYSSSRCSGCSTHNCASCSG